MQIITAALYYICGSKQDVKTMCIFDTDIDLSGLYLDIS